MNLMKKKRLTLEEITRE